MLIQRPSTAMGVGTLMSKIRSIDTVVRCLNSVLGSLIEPWKLACTDRHVEVTQTCV